MIIIVLLVFIIGTYIAWIKLKNIYPVDFWRSLVTPTEVDSIISRLNYPSETGLEMISVFNNSNSYTSEDELNALLIKQLSKNAIFVHAQGVKASFEPKALGKLCTTSDGKNKYLFVKEKDNVFSSIHFATLTGFSISNTFIHSTESTHCLSFTISYKLFIHIVNVIVLRNGYDKATINSDKGVLGLIEYDNGIKKTRLTYTTWIARGVELFDIVGVSNSLTLSNKKPIPEFSEKNVYILSTTETKNSISYVISPNYPFHKTVFQYNSFYPSTDNSIVNSKLYPFNVKVT